MEEIKLIENFLSWQGEGPDSGKTMIILRFKTCNLKCSWCDTQVKMRVSAEASYKLSDIQETIGLNAAGILVTGGEPTVKRHFKECVTLLNELDYPVANVESNGHALWELIGEVDPLKPIKYMYSPKIFNAQDEASAKETLNKIAGHQNVYIKMVFEPDNKYSLRFMKFLAAQKDLIWGQRIWVMPEGTNRAALIKNAEGAFDMCEKHNFCFSSRSHIMFGFV